MHEVKILLVDDEIDLLDIYEDSLSSLKFPIDRATNGSEALAKCSVNNYGVIISDINMPVMNGIEFLKCLREKKINTPLIFITGYGDKEKLREAWVWGAFDFLDKPIDYDLFQKTVQNALNLTDTLSQNNEREAKLGYSKAVTWLEKNTFDALNTHCKENLISVSSFLESLIKQNIK